LPGWMCKRERVVLCSRTISELNAICNYIPCTTLLYAVIDIVSARCSSRWGSSIFRDFLLFRCGVRTSDDVTRERNAMIRRDVRVAFIKNIKATLGACSLVYARYSSKPSLRMRYVSNILPGEFMAVSRKK